MESRSLSLDGTIAPSAAPSGAPNAAAGGTRNIAKEATRDRNKLDEQSVVEEQRGEGSSFKAGSGRLVSLDVFRGVTIAAMILVNNSGGRAYGPLDHAEWNGWTHTDLIFPFFLFIAGISMAMSFAARLRRGDSRGELAWHTVRRGATIFAIGLCLNAFPYFFGALHYANLRIPGVLQRIGFCYALAGLVYLYGDSRARGGAIIVALLGYWAAMKLVPVAGYGAGDLAPTHNLAAYVDQAIFTMRHMWQHRAWDPEGLLSSVPAMCTLLIGTFVGQLFVESNGPAVSSREIQQRNPTQGASADTPEDDGERASAASIDHRSLRAKTIERGPYYSSIQSTWQYKVRKLVVWGGALMVMGEVWNLWFPINKNLWTSSYVVFSAGYAMLALAALYWVVDVRGWRKWTMPFRVFGMNAILAFTLSTWVTKNLLIYKVASGKGSVSAWSWLIRHTYWPYFSDVRNSSLAFALTYVGIWWMVMWWFYKKQIFLKV